LSELPVEFVGSFPEARRQLTPILPEVAFLGRSNVGKSSLINAVVGRRIARTSGTPGKTQHLNVFRFPSFYLIDLPGYGYAKLALGERRRLRALVDDTIRGRTDLVAVIWLLDIRHPISKDDLGMYQLLADSRRQAIVVLTKADKLPRAQRRVAWRARAAELDLEPDDLLVTSSSNGEGIVELAEAIEEAVAERR
jgi:GTP-binding protein